MEYAAVAKPGDKSFKQMLDVYYDYYKEFHEMGYPEPGFIRWEGGIPHLFIDQTGEQFHAVAFYGTTPKMDERVSLGDGMSWLEGLEEKMLEVEHRIFHQYVKGLHASWHFEVPIKWGDKEVTGVHLVFDPEFKEDGRPIDTKVFIFEKPPVLGFFFDDIPDPSPMLEAVKLKKKKKSADAIAVKVEEPEERREVNTPLNPITVVAYKDALLRFINDHRSEATGTSRSRPVKGVHVKISMEDCEDEIWCLWIRGNVNESLGVAFQDEVGTYFNFEAGRFKTAVLNPIPVVKMEVEDTVEQDCFIVDPDAPVEAVKTIETTTEAGGYAATKVKIEPGYECEEYVRTERRFKFELRLWFEQDVPEFVRNFQTLLQMALAAE